MKHTTTATGDCILSSSLCNTCIKAFFRGVVPPLWGSMVYRAINLSAYEMAFTWFETSFPAESAAKVEILGVLRPMVVASAVFAGLCRSLFESNKCLISHLSCSG